MRHSSPSHFLAKKRAQLRRNWPAYFRKKARKHSAWLRFSRPEPRLEPSFFLIGAQKAGTSSLMQLLRESPHVMRPLKKEVHYFDRHFAKPLRWYRAHFPTLTAVETERARVGDPILTGEASPSYLFHPLVPARLARHYPEAKLIILLRDPVARALSHYFFMAKDAREPLSLEDALAAEQDRTRGGFAAAVAAGRELRYSDEKFAYVGRGQYAPQIRHWMRWFPRERFLFLRAEEYYATPQVTADRLADFLAIPRFTLRPRGARSNTGSRRHISPETRAWLAAQFAESNADLKALTGIDFTGSSEAEQPPASPVDQEAPAP